MGYCTKGLFLAGTSGLKVVVQPCTRRVFTDEEYEDCDILWPLWPNWWTLGWSVKIDPAMADSLYLEIIFSMIFWETSIYIIHQLTSLCNPRSFYVLQPVAVCENILSDILPWILGGWLGWCCHQNRVCHPDKSQDSKTAKTVRFDRIPVSITRSSLMFSKRAWICLGWRLLNWICTILHNVFLSWHGVPQFVAKIRS
jgi:hypothetical protein